MIVELTREAEGPDGILPIGHRISDPLAWVHVVKGIAVPVDDEAREKAEVEKMRGQARAERRRRDQERKRKEAEERRDRKRKLREERIKQYTKLTMQAQVEAAEELAQEHDSGTAEQSGDSGS